jgi:hypothetical protein
MGQGSNKLLQCRLARSCVPHTFSLTMKFGMTRKQQAVISWIYIWSRSLVLEQCKVVAFHHFDALYIYIYIYPLAVYVRIADQRWRHLTHVAYDLHWQKIEGSSAIIMDIRSTYGLMTLALASNLFYCLAAKSMHEYKRCTYYDVCKAIYIGSDQKAKQGLSSWKEVFSDFDSVKGDHVGRGFNTIPASV